MKRYFLIPLTFLSAAVFGQVGGENTYQFLDLDFSARSMALGGDFIPLADGDINLAVSNPASIREEMHNQFALNHFIYPAGINYGQLAYGAKLNKVGVFTTHMRYVSYGRFTRTDETGIESGTFTAGDYALGVGYAHQLNKIFSIGANFNTIFSHYESYGSWGMGADVAANMYHEESNITATIVARNIGYQIKGYTKKSHEPLPLEVLAGVSYKFHHAPFRLGLVMTDLTEWDLTYNDPTLQPTIDQLTGDTIPVPKASFFQKLAYHSNFSVEIVPNENIYVRLGFNYQRRNSLGIVDRMAAGGFSFGFGFKVKRFSFNYGLSFYSAAGASNAIGIAVNFNERIRKE